MNLTRFLTTAIFFLFFSIAYSQTIQKKNQLEFSIGHNFGFLKNLEFAPVSQYDYNNLLYRLNYQRTGKTRNLFEVQFDYLNSDIESSSIPELNAGYTKLGLGFSYLKQVYNDQGILLHLGLQSQSNFSDYDIANSNYTYFVLHQEFGLAGKIRYQLNEKHHLSSKITVPFALFRVTDANANIKSFGRYQSVLWNFKYGYKLSEDFDLKASYNFNYNRLQVPNAYRELQHQINLGINYKF